MFQWTGNNQSEKEQTIVCPRTLLCRVFSVYSVLTDLELLLLAVSKLDSTLHLQQKNIKNFVLLWKHLGGNIRESALNKIFNTLCILSCNFVL